MGKIYQEEAEDNQQQSFDQIKIQGKTHEEMRELIDKIKVAPFDEISLFADANKSSGFSDKALEYTKVGDIESEIQVLLHNVIKACSTNTSKKQKGFIGRFMTATAEKISDIKRQYNSIQEHLELVVKEIEKKEEGVLEGRKSNELLLQKNTIDYQENSVVLEAMKIARDELIQESNITDEDKMQSLLLSEGKAFRLELLDHTIDDLIATQTQLCFETEQLIREIANAKRVELSTKSTIKKVTNVWKNSLIIHINSLKTKDAVKMIDLIQKSTNLLFINNAEQIAENSKEVFAITSKSFNNIEAFEEVQKIVKDQFEEIAKMTSDTAKTRQQNYLRMSKFTQNTQLAIANNDSNIKQLK